MKRTGEELISALTVLLRGIPEPLSEPFAEPLDEPSFEGVVHLGS